MAKKKIDNLAVRNAIDDALAKLGLTVDFGYDTATGGIATDYVGENFRVTVEIRN